MEPIARRMAELLDGVVLDESRNALGRQRIAHLREELAPQGRSEEHTSELQSLMRISYAVFCLKKKNRNRVRTGRSPNTPRRMQQLRSVQHCTPSYVTRKLISTKSISRTGY